jgi:hypothetical protein
MQGGFLHGKFNRLILIPVGLLATIGVGLFILAGIAEISFATDYLFLKNAVIKSIYLLVFILSVLFIISAVFYFYNYIKKDSLFIRNKTIEFKKFYDQLYDYCINSNINSESIQNLKKNFTNLSMYLSDKTLIKLNKFLDQPQNWEKNKAIKENDKKNRLISFEEAVLLLREELGISKLKKKSTETVLTTGRIFKKLEQKWFEWSKARVWFFEACSDFGASSLEMMKKHSLIFVGGGPSGSFGQSVKQIRKDDIVICHKYLEGYVSVGIVTVDKKAVIWPKDNPLFYSDGEIRIPVRWLLFLNVGVDTGYVPEGILSKFYELDECLKVLNSLKERAIEAGNEFSKDDINNLTQKLTGLINVSKPVYDRIEKPWKKKKETTF